VLPECLVDVSGERGGVLVKDEREWQKRGMGARKPFAPKRCARFAKREVAQEAEPFDGLAHRPRDLLELAAGPLHPRESDETAQGLVRPLHQQVGACIA